MDDKADGKIGTAAKRRPNKTARVSGDPMNPTQLITLGSKNIQDYQ
jgi:hypothetical protein